MRVVDAATEADELAAAEAEDAADDAAADDDAATAEEDAAADEAEAEAEGDAEADGLDEAWADDCGVEEAGVLEAGVLEACEEAAEEAADDAAELLAALLAEFPVPDGALPCRRWMMPSRSACAKASRAKNAKSKVQSRLVNNMVNMSMSFRGPKYVRDPCVVKVTRSQKSFRKLGQSRIRADAVMDKSCERSCESRFENVCTML